MRVAIVNPPWSCEGRISFGCREPHLPLELGNARALDEGAWEPAHDPELGRLDSFSDIHEKRPIRLPVLEGEVSR